MITKNILKRDEYQERIVSGEFLELSKYDKDEKYTYYKVEYKSSTKHKYTIIVAVYD